MRVLFSGGGTLGPVVPLIAIKETLLKAHPQAKFSWIGTAQGPEKSLVQAAGIDFYTIPSGKWRRYFSVQNFTDIFKIIAGFFKSLILLGKIKPTIVISCGGFVSVPVHWAASWMRIPAWVHQQDVQVGLANKLMFGSAAFVTTALKNTAGQLSAYGARWIGNPCRNLAVTPQDLPKWYQFFGIPAGAFVVLVVGGGTGALALNNIVLSALPEIPPDWHIIHLLGNERPKEAALHAASVYKNYHIFTFLAHEMAGAYALANIVVARAGMGTLTELANLSKPAIIFPKSETHQEANANFFGEQGAVLVLDEKNDTGGKLGALIKQLINQPPDAIKMGARLHQLLPACPDEVITKLAEQI